MRLRSPVCRTRARVARGAVDRDVSRRTSAAPAPRADARKNCTNATCLFATRGQFGAHDEASPPGRVPLRSSLRVWPGATDRR
jgi:hypothetical protein